MIEVLYVTPFLIAIALLIIMASGSPDPSRPDDAFPVASAEYLAKLMRLRSVIALGVIGALATYGLVTEDLVIMMKFSSPVFALVVLLAIARWIEAVLALRMLRNDGVLAERWGDVIVIRHGADRQIVHANAWLVKRARARAIPRATL
jgi:hypothetical protein